MEAAAGLAMQSRAVGIGAGPGGRWDAVLGGCGEKRARTGTLRIGGPAGAAAPVVTVRARGNKPVASLCYLDTSRVWQKLEEENREFFKAYYMRLMLKSQIMVFNRLLEDQYRLMSKEHPAGVPSMPPTAPNVCNSGT